MAYIRVKKSDSAYTDIPLTEEKPIPPSVEVYSGGQFYYNPLVKSGWHLDSGVRVRCNGSKCALATEIYNPVNYNTSGRELTIAGEPYIETRGECIFPKNAALQLKEPVEFDGKEYLSVWFDVLFTGYPSGTQYVISFQRVDGGNGYLALGIDSNSKFYANKYNASRIKTGAKPALNEWYGFGFDYYDGILSLTLGDNYYENLSVSLPAGTYTLYIGAPTDSKFSKPFTISVLHGILPGSDYDDSYLPFGYY